MDKVKFDSKTYLKNMVVDPIELTHGNYGTSMYKHMKLPTNTEDKASKEPEKVATAYKYDEGAFLEALRKHVDSTYTSHYGGQIQPVEFVMSNAESLDYLKGNVVKYVYRYGKKDGANVADLMKACHFIMMMARYGDKK